MSPGGIVALVVGLFFVIGIIVGVITVIALSVIRHDRALGNQGYQRTWISRRSEPSILDEADEVADDIQTGASGVAGHWDGINGINDTTTDGASSDDRPRWPGDTDGGYPGATP